MTSYSRTVYEFHDPDLGPEYFGTRRQAVQAAEDAGASAADVEKHLLCRGLSRKQLALDCLNLNTRGMFSPFEAKP